MHYAIIDIYNVCLPIAVISPLRAIPMHHRLKGYFLEEGQQLKEAGLKITAPRLKILQVLEQSQGQHLSAENIYKTLLAMQEDVGLATVYRVLTQFEAAGIVVRHYFEGGYSVFELKQDEHHDHLFCIKCGSIQEFFDPLIEQQQQVIAERARFKITDHSLNIYGICERCMDLPLNP